MHWRGEGGIREMLYLGFPLVLSEMLEFLMTFCDRWFLSHLGPEYTAASFVAANTVWTLLAFLFGLCAYISALAGQYVGSNEIEKAGRTLFQGLWIALLALPLCWTLIPAGEFIFSNSGHPENQIPLEQSYYRVLMAGGFLVIGRVVVASFLSGIGHTRPVAIASITGLLVNLPLNYTLIFGNFGFPAMGVQGAAIATLMSEGIILLSLGGWLWRNRERGFFKGPRLFQINPEILRSLWRVGAFNGFDFFLQMAGFNFFLFCFTIYGPIPAASLSIVLTWETFFILPLFAAELATMSLAGRYTGQGRPDRVKRTVLSSTQLNLTYTCGLAILLLVAAPQLAGVFIQSEGADPAILEMSVEMMRGLGLYMIANGISFAFSGGLKGARDTVSPMVISGTCLLLPAIICALLVKFAPGSHMVAWWIYLGINVIKSFIMVWRFQSNKWMLPHGEQKK
ncbi:MAG: MATE family efflux transporter [Candidatus Nitronauta litoralis]|uniref:Multidrug-efflux transporter n=1 Tax=Candidatus Nitronauta litoralis TaxID=2705533 RepID=A0A7T0BW37_9BACT|nr:MAG: MATE family efflux transporter [Candidatus Nitronauta litoralis]